MNPFHRIDTGALLLFDLILLVTMAVILFMTRMGLGTAARRVDVWLVGSLLLLGAHVVSWLQPMHTLPGRNLAIPVILAGLYWQAEGMRALRTERTRMRRTLVSALAGMAAAGGLMRVLGDAITPVLFVIVNVLMLRHALLLSRRFWGGRLLAAATLVLLVFNAVHLVVPPGSPDEIVRGGLHLEMVWTLFSTAGFLQCLYQDIRDRLAAAAVTDALTNALNRTGIMPLLQRDIEQARRGGGLSVALCDLDHFKAINDTHGHPTGDKVLQRFASTVRGCLRAGDLIGRWGGEEFLLVLPRATLAEATEVVRRVQATIAGCESPPSFTFSAGIACAGEGRVRYDLEQLLAVADQRLYIAKRTRDAVVSRDDDVAPPEAPTTHPMPVASEASAALSL